MFFSISRSFIVFMTSAILAAAMPWDTPTTTVAAPAPTATSTPASSCSSSSLQCCNSTDTSSSASGAALLGLLGIGVDGTDVPIGLDCSPITVAQVGSSCGGSAVCCEDNDFNGVVAVGCVPVTL